MLWYLTFKSIEQQAIYVYICKYICSLPGKLHTVSNNLETLVYVNKYKENCFLWQKEIVWCFNIEFLINKTKQWIKIFGWSIWLHVPDIWIPGIWISEVQQNCISHEPLSNIAVKKTYCPEYSHHAEQVPHRGGGAEYGGDRYRGRVTGGHQQRGVPQHGQWSHCKENRNMTCFFSNPFQITSCIIFY